MIVTTKVIDVAGIGPKTAEYLISEGIETANDLVNAGIGQLMQAPGFHLNRANTVLNAARVLIASGGEGVEATKNPVKKKKPKKEKEGKAKSKKSKKDKEGKKAKKGKGKGKAKDKKKGKKKKKS
jgi:endonuclease III